LAKLSEFFLFEKPILNNPVKCSDCFQPAHRTWLLTRFDSWKCTRVVSGRSTSNDGKQPTKI